MTWLTNPIRQKTSDVVYKLQRLEFLQGFWHWLELRISIWFKFCYKFFHWFSKDSGQLVSMTSSKSDKSVHFGDTRHKVRPQKLETFEAQWKRLRRPNRFWFVAKFLFLYKLGPSRSPFLTESSFIFLEAPN